MEKRHYGNGSTIANSESHYYQLSTDYVVYAPMLYNFDPASGSLYFENRPKGYMSAYFYSGLCFAGVRQSIGTGESTYFFHLRDNKNNVKYLLRAKADLSTKRAWILPALNDKASSKSPMLQMAHRRCRREWHKSFFMHIFEC